LDSPVDSKTNFALCTFELLGKRGDWVGFEVYFSLTYLLLIIALNSYFKFFNCVDPFHEVKSKREKKKEVRA
jgi:hypothetical protein